MSHPPIKFFHVVSLVTKWFGAMGMRWNPLIKSYFEVSQMA